MSVIGRFGPGIPRRRVVPRRGWRTPAATAPIGARSGRTRSADRTGVRAMTRSTATPGSREAGVAFGAPVAMIRHRFGGNLRAARAEASCRRPSCTVARSRPRRPKALLRAIGSQPGQAGLDPGPESGWSRATDRDRPGIRAIACEEEFWMKQRIAALVAAAVFAISACAAPGYAAATSAIHIVVLSRQRLEQGADGHDGQRHQDGHRREWRQGRRLLRSTTSTRTTTAAAGQWDEATRDQNPNDVVANDKLVAYLGRRSGRGQAVDPDPVHRGHRHGQPRRPNRRAALRQPLNRASRTSTTRTAARRTTTG